MLLPTNQVQTTIKHEIAKLIQIMLRMLSVSTGVEVQNLIVQVQICLEKVKKMYERNDDKQN